MASSLAKQPHHRQSTRSNSASSSSVVTVQRAASTRSGSRANTSGLRPQSPNEINYNPGNLSVRNFSPESRRRSSAGNGRPDSSNGVREGVGNLNRWSQSTVSSNSSATHHRKGSISKRLSGSLGSFGTFTHPQSSPPNSKGPSRFRPSASTSPEEPTRKFASAQAIPQASNQHYHQPPPTLPPIVTLTSLSQAVEAADSPSSAVTATPATADLLSSATYQPEPDYFGNRWRARSPLSQPRSDPALQKASPIPSPGANANAPSTNPNRRPPTLDTEPTAQLTDRAVSKYSDRASGQHKKRRREPRSSYSHNHVEENRGRRSAEAEDLSSGTDRYGKDRKVPSQKAMLSKALQKAKHAVLLDNAQNFEGAIDAYSDACSLLQSVMSRSSGDEYRMKLESVVSAGLWVNIMSVVTNVS